MNHRHLHSGLRALVPPFVSEWAVRRSKYSTRFIEVASWDTAIRNSTGYSDSDILDRVDASTRLVISGEAAYERDGFTFNQPDVRWPVLAGLLHAHARDGYLRVLDFGGSLGSTYWQHRRLLANAVDQWAIVEQQGFIERGKALPTSDIDFHADLNTAIDHVQPNVILFSSVLQYLEDPVSMVSQLWRDTTADIVIDRTPMWSGPENVATIQQVPVHLYQGSYPAWIISEPLLLRLFEFDGSVTKFMGIESDTQTSGGKDVTWQGLLVTRKKEL